METAARPLLHGYAYHEEHQDDVKASQRQSWHNKQHMVLIVLSTAMFAVLVVVLGLLDILPYFRPRPVLHIRRPATGPYTQYVKGSFWHSWQDAKHMMVFGDSWSATGYNASTPPPNVTHPFSAPTAWPGLEAGHYTGGGPHWPAALTSIYNESLITSVNFAISGATVAYPTAPLNGSTLLVQYERDYREAREKRLEKSAIVYDWPANNTLTALWFGVNDVLWNLGSDFPYEDTIHAYANTVEGLYQDGARNFLFITAPPVDQLPVAKMYSETSELHQGAAEWNARLAGMAWSFANKYPDTTVILFDSFNLIKDLLRDPCQRSASCGLITTGWHCSNYSDKGDIPLGGHADPLCGKTPFNDYFFADAFHLTGTMQDVTASAIVQALKAAGAD